MKLMYGFPGATLRRKYFEEICTLCEKKKKTILIVPEQQVLDYEDESMSFLPESAPLTFTVASFSLLAEIAERKFGGLSYKLLTKPIKSLYMWKAIREMRSGLLLYGRSSPEKLVSLMSECIDELKTSGITPEDIEDTLPHIKDSEELSSKLSDVLKIYSAYSALIGNKYTDQNDSLMKLSNILKDNRIFEGYEIYIDSFTDFTPLQLRILRSLIPFAANVTVALPTNPAEDMSIQFETVRKTVSELTKIADDYSLSLTSETYAPELDESVLEFAVRNVWKPNVKPRAFSPDSRELPIEIYSCQNRTEEVYATVNLVRRALFEGQKLSDIAIVSRNPSQYKKLLDSSAKEAGLNLFSSEKTSLSHKVFINYIQSLLRIIGFGWRREDVLAHLKCGLTDTSERDIQRYELYVTRWNLNGKKQLCGSIKNASYNVFRKESNEEDEYSKSTEKVKKEELSHISELEKEFTSAKTVADMLRILFEYIERRKIRTHLSDLATSLAEYGDSAEADQTARVYTATVKLFDDTAFSVGSDPAISVREFSSLLELLFSVSDLGSIPTHQDRLILADASLYRSFGHKTVILLGCVSGEFPASVKKAGIINSAEKERLKKENLVFSQNVYDAASREYMYFWRSMGLAREKLIILHPEKTESDGENTRSSGIDKLISIIPGLHLQKFSESIDKLIYEPHSILNMLSVYAPQSELYGEISDILKQSKESSEILPRSGCSLVGNHTIDSKTADRFIKEPFFISPTDLEKFNGCAFQYFCKKLLRLDTGERNEFDRRTAGEIIHAAVEVFLDSENPSDKSLNEIRDICNAAVDEYYKKVCPEHLLDNERLRFAFKRAAISATILSMYLGGELKTSKFAPLSSEFDTKEIGGITIEADKKAVITGRIDRIDSASYDGNNFLRVIDYKTGHTEFSLLDMESGKLLQLPIYLFSVLRDGALPGGFLYISSATEIPKYQSVKSIGTTEDVCRKIASEIKSSGILNTTLTENRKLPKKIIQCMTDDINEKLESVQEVVKNSVNRIFSGDFKPSPSSEDGSPCKYCKFGPICRQKPKFSR